MDEISRRSFTRNVLGSLLTFSLFETLFECNAFAEKVRPITARWLSDVNQLGFYLKDQKVSQIIWQDQLEKLFAQVDLEELLGLIDFDKLTKNVKLKERGARSLRFSFRQLEGVPEKLAYGKQVFALKKGRSVVPHGHNNMATAFIILKGEFHGRHYDRLEDEKDHVIIRSTIDERFAPGDYSTVSDFKDNVHWFKATSEPAFIFNIHALNVGIGKKRTGRVYLDPNGEKLTASRIRAPRLTYDEAHRRYG
ncbi:MAG: hypothetical protein ABGX16_16540 [Pirellulales bacterium]